MNAEQIAKLKALAQAATPGPWSTGTTSRQKIHEKLPPMYEAAVHVGDDSNRGNCLATIFLGGRGALYSDLQSVSDNAAYIAAANPAAILELIALAERALLAAAPAPIQQGKLVEVGQMIEFDDHEDPRFHTIMCDWDNEARAKLTSGTKIYAVSAGSQVQAAGDEVNEREAFEAMVKERFVTSKYCFTRSHTHGYINTISSNTYGGRKQPEYASLQMLWDVWDARATIAKKAMRE